MTGLSARHRAARALRRLAAVLDDRRAPAVTVTREQWEADGGLEASIEKAARRHLRPLPGSAVVTAGYAQGRADLQLTHGTDALLAEMYRDPQHPLRVAADRDLRERAARMQQDGKDRWNRLMSRGHGASEGDAEL